VTWCGVPGRDSGSGGNAFVCVEVPPLEVRPDRGPPLVVAPLEVLLPWLVAVVMGHIVRLFCCCWVGLALAEVSVGERCRVFSLVVVCLAVGECMPSAGGRCRRVY
jgi:hypothetical protein